MSHLPRPDGRHATVTVSSAQIRPSQLRPTAVSATHAIPIGASPPAAPARAPPQSGALRSSSPGKPGGGKGADDGATTRRMCIAALALTGLLIGYASGGTPLFGGDARGGAPDCPGSWAKTGVRAGDGDVWQSTDGGYAYRAAGGGGWRRAPSLDDVRQGAGEPCAAAATAAAPAPAGGTYSVGAKLRVKSKSGVARVCSVVEAAGDRVKVHYEGFKDKFDEWLPASSPRVLGPAPGDGGGGAEAAPAPQPAATPAGEYQAGDKVTVSSKSGVKRPCTVVEAEAARIKVHYDGFKDKYDEWVDLSSPRLHGKRADGAESAATPAQPAAAEKAAPAEGAAQYHAGDKVSVNSKSGVKRLCTVVEVDASRIKVHYEGFKDKYDEWIPLSSERLLGKADAPADAPAGAAPATPATSSAAGDESAYKAGDKVNVKSKSGVKRLCTVVEAEATRVKVHYEGFKDKYDEWIELSSERFLGKEGAAAGDAAAAPAGGGDAAAPATSSSSSYSVGTKVYVMSKSGVKRMCEVAEVDGTARVKVHYEGYEAKYDEWLDLQSKRLVGPVDTKDPLEGTSSGAGTPAVDTSLDTSTVQTPSANGAYKVGDKVEVNSKSGVKRSCAVVEVGAGRIKVHYDGFKDKYDEWLPLSSERLLGKARGAGSADPAAATRDPRTGGGGAKYAVGDKVNVNSKSGVKRLCTVVETDSDRIKVHYEGFKDKYDEWVELSSPRLLGKAPGEEGSAGTAEDSGAAPAPATATAQSTAAGTKYPVGSKVNVNSKSGTKRLCTVVEAEETRIKVHYEGFKDKYDEWLELSSERILGAAQQDADAAAPAAAAAAAAAAPAAAAAAPASATSGSAKYAVGTKVDVKSKSGVKRLCTVVEAEATRIKIHYEGFKDKYDEWIELSSERLVGPAADDGAAAEAAPQSVVTQPSQTDSASSTSSAASPSQQWAPGTKVNVKSKSGVKRLCSVVEAEATRVKVHYEGFKDKYDEWVDLSSDRFMGAAAADGAAAPASAAALTPGAAPAVPAPGSGGGAGDEQAEQPAADGAYSVGDRVWALGKSGAKRRRCTVVSTEDPEGKGRIKIHYNGYKEQYDEWLAVPSPRLVGRID